MLLKQLKIEKRRLVQRRLRCINVAACELSASTLAVRNCVGCVYESPKRGLCSCCARSCVVATPWPMTLRHLHLSCCCDKCRRRCVNVAAGNRPGTPLWRGVARGACGALPRAVIMWRLDRLVWSRGMGLHLLAVEPRTQTVMVVKIVCELDTI